MWASKVVGIDLRDRRNIGESNKKKLDPCRQHGQQQHHGGNNQERGPDLDAKAAVGRKIDGLMRGIERDHRMSPEILPCIP